MKPYIDDEDHFDIGFEQFRVKPGLDLELHDSNNRLLEHKAQFVMAHPGKDVLIAIQVSDADKIAMETGKRYQVSGFNGRFDFSFTSAVMKVDRSQFTVLMAAPATVSIRFVRKHQRAELSLPASILRAGQATPAQVTLKNLSMGGASMDSVGKLGAAGESFTLRLQITFDGTKEDLSLLSVIRRVSESGNSLMFNTGVEFANAGREDKLLLHYYIATLANEYNLI